MRNILFTTQKKNVTWVQREVLRFNNKNNQFQGNKTTKPPSLSVSLSSSLPQALKHELHPNIQDMLQIIHKTSCHSKYNIVSSMKMYAWIDWMQTDAWSTVCGHIL